ncbi:Cro/CI family transcriptional regulator [Pseudomonas bohemica]|uniref:Cro/CI family transcriptional regulator n=1 Tax=Pseudomonas bohemica TaxID=2044872 RepID=UPI000DA62EC5|nr:Cro/CI family transcriptional regulator [Pseudomonas bohemica]
MKTTQAVSHFGSKKKLADALDISPSAVTLWGEVIPRLRQFQIQMLTGGALAAEVTAPPNLNQSSNNALACTSGPDGAVLPSSVSDVLA